MNRIVINVQTGEKEIIPLTQAEIDEINARPAPEQPPAPDPVEKLRAFLSANPDVAAIL